MLNVAVSQQSTVGWVGCVPVTNQVQEVLSKVAVSQQSTVGWVGGKIHDPSSKLAEES